MVMNKKDRIDILEEQHARLAVACEELEKSRQADRRDETKIKLLDLKKKKLAVKDEISLLQKKYRNE